MAEHAHPPDDQLSGAIEHDSLDDDDVGGALVQAEDAENPRSHVRTALAAGLVAVLALGGLAGWLGYRALEGHRTDAERNVLLQTARRTALNLTTIDHAQAEADVQRILDSATGSFRDDFQQRSPAFIDVVKNAQSKSEGTITESGLESTTDDEGQVLVAVSVRTSNVSAAEQEPRAWRMRLTVQKTTDGAKVSNVEFVP